jgi:NAD(P)H dehydrogenase (quinone)
MADNGFHPSVAVAYHSGFGHTAVLAEAVHHGAEQIGAVVHLIAVDPITEADWPTLDGADAIVFGCPTYMGDVSAAFKAFEERTGRRCQDGTWRDKVAAGFTNSGAKSGDKSQTLMSLAVFAAQHHMHWVNLGLVAGWNHSSSSADDLNRLGFFLGAAAQSDVDTGPDRMHDSDVLTCRYLGRRVATVARQLVAGRLVMSAASSPAASSAPTR